MTTKPTPAVQAVVARSRRQFRACAQAMPLIGRLDLGLIVVIGVMLALILGAWIVAVVAGERAGWYDPPRLVPLADDRILLNVRDPDLTTSPLLDAVLDAATGEIAVSQAGGRIHRYNPATELWTTETPFAGAEGGEDAGNYDLLRAGCGGVTLLPECVEDGTIWALDRGAGVLSRRINGRWETVLGGSRFLAAGAPVQTDDLTAAAISDGGRFVVLGTRNGAVGVYDTNTHRWQSVIGGEAGGGAGGAGEAIARMVFWRGVFWVGAGDGLLQLTVNENGVSVQADNNLPAGAQVLDLDADPDGALWVLAERACEDTPGRCRLMAAYTAPDQAELVFDEANRYADLDLESVNFAQMQSAIENTEPEMLVLAGRAGIFAYDTGVHRWSQLGDTPVTATLPDADGRGFTFATAEAIGTVRGGAVADLWETFAAVRLSEDEHVIKLLNGLPGEVLALTDGGRVYSVTRATGAVQIVFAGGGRGENGGGTALDPATFTSAIAAGESVLFLGDGGGLLLNTRTRAYEDLLDTAGGSRLPDWLTSGETTLIPAGETVFALVSREVDDGQAGIEAEAGAETGVEATAEPLPDSDAGSRTTVYALPAAQLGDADFLRAATLDSVPRAELDDGINPARAWVRGDGALGLIARGGGVLYATAPGSPVPPLSPDVTDDQRDNEVLIEMVTGAAIPELDGALFADVIGVGIDDLAALLRLPGGLSQIRRYRMESRAWNAPLTIAQDDPPQELAAWDEALYWVTLGGRLVGENGAIIGGSQDDARLIETAAQTDALIQADALYLAGSGQVQQYSLSERRIVESWPLAGVQVAEAITPEATPQPELTPELTPEVAIQLEATPESTPEPAVRLIGVVNEQPLTLSGGVTRLGATPLPGAGGVETISLSSDAIYLLEQPAGEETPVLAAYPLADPLNPEARQCYFRQPTADAAAILDARSLNDVGSAILAATDAGLRAYLPGLRSWAGVETDLPATRLYALGEGDARVLLAANQPEFGAETTLTAIDARTLVLPPSCSNDPVTFSTVPLAGDSAEPLMVQAFAANESAGRAAWLLPTGEVAEWQPGAGVRTVLSSTENAPPSADLHRLFDRQSESDSLLFASGNALYRYRLPLQQWERTGLENVGGDIRDVIAVTDGERDWLTVTAAQEGRTAFYTGQLAPDSTAAALAQVARVFDPASTRPFATADLLDLQRREDGGQWAHVYRNGVAYFNAAERAWARSNEWETSDGQLLQAFTGSEGVQPRAVWVAEDSQNGDWWIGQDAGDTPTRFAPIRAPEADAIATALGSDAAVYRLNEGREVERCASPDGVEEYTCTVILAPFAVDQAEVLRAFRWNDLILFQTGDGLRAFDPQSGGEAELPPAVAQPGALASIVLINDALLLYRADGRLIVWDERGAETIADVGGLVQDENGLIWANIGGVWQLFDGGAFAPVPDAANLNTFALFDQPVTALDSARTPYRYDGRTGTFVAGDLPLPAAFDQATVTALIPGVAGDWWVVAGSGGSAGELSHVVVGSCGGAEAQATGEATPELTPEATNEATPEATPCLTTSPDATIPLPAGVQNPVSARVETDSLELVAADGLQVRVVSAGGALQLEETTPGDPPALFPPDEQDAVYDEFARVQLPDGRAALDPVANLALDDDGLLIAEHESGTTRIIGEGIAAAFRDDFALPPALDAGWLRYNRDANTFTVQTGEAGTTDYAPDEWLLAGENGDPVLRAEAVTAVLARAGDSAWVATPFGLFIHAAPDLNLNDPELRYLPGTLPTDLTPVEGGFLADGAIIRPEGGQIARDPLQTITTQVGAATFTHAATPGIEATVTVGESVRPAFAEQGFVWDANRRGLAYDGDTLLVQSDPGVSEVGGGLAAFDLGPQDLGLTGLLVSEASTAYLHPPETSVWFARTDTGWETSVDPTQDRALFSTPGTSWALDGGDVVVTANDGTALEVVSVVSDENGLGFAADQLRAAAAVRPDSSDLVVITGAATEIGSPAAWAGNTENAITRLPALNVDRLEAVRQADGLTRLYGYRGATAYALDPATGALSSTPEAADPVLNRLAAENNRLRFRLAGGAMVSELRLDPLAGETEPSVWAAFALTDGRFPFDVVTSAARYGDAWIVGTAAGLSVYADPASVGLDDLTALYGLNPTATAFTPVTRAGVPEAAPGVFAAIGQAPEASDAIALCIERTPLNPTFAPCTPERAAQLETRLRAETALWRWTETSGTASGVYRDTAGGQAAGDPIALPGGQFPHDRIEQAVTCDIGEDATPITFAAWGNGWLTAYPDPRLPLIGGGTAHEFRPAPVQQLFCLTGQDVSGDAEQANAERDSGLQPGAYTQDENGVVYRYEGGSWARVADPGAAARLFARIAARPVFEEGRLRLVPGETEAQGSFVWQYNRAAGDGSNGGEPDWNSVPWVERAGDEQGERWTLAIDLWREVVVTPSGGYWAATAAGLTPFERDTADGTALFDPATLEIVAEPVLPDGTLCNITDLMAAGGEGEAENDQAFARCDARSEAVYVGSLAPQPTNAARFAPYAGADPFAAQLLITAETAGVDYWEWARIGRVNGLPGTLRFSVNGEPMMLAGGRFAFDTPNALALPGDRLDLATGGAGWFTLPGAQAAGLNALSLSEWARPEDDGIEQPGAYTQIGITYVPGTDDLPPGLALCAQTGDGARLLLRPDLAGEWLAAPAAACPEYAGEDALWRYEVGEAVGEVVGNLRVVLSSADGNTGEVFRALADGRFSDDVPLGLPTVARADAGASATSQRDIPTIAGAIGLDAGNRTVSLIPVAAPPAVVFRLPDGTLAAAGANGFTRLLPAQIEGVAADLAANLAANLAADLPGGWQLPADALPIAVEQYTRTSDGVNTSDLLRVRYQNADGSRGWAWADAALPNDQLPVRLPSDVRRPATAGDSILAAFLPGNVAVQLLFGENGQPSPEPTALADDFLLLDALPAGDRLLLAGRNEVFALGLERAMQP